MQLGKYQHFRNKLFYQVIGVAIHSETLEEMVVYTPLYDSPDYKRGQLWVRPKAMFLELLQHEGREISRFTFVE